jgi:1-acyl-sn-glycerol-3-phosphate acyltransferase
MDLYANLALKMDIQWQAPLPEGAKIIAPNHPTTIDPFLMLHIIREPVNILVTGAAFQVPGFGRYLRRLGHVPVIRGSGRAALEAGKDLLAEGRTVVIFPEGSLSPEVGAFHRPRTGTARLALISGAPVIPVGIHLDAKQVRPVTAKIEGDQVPGRVYYGGPYAVTIGRPVHFHGSVEDRTHVRSVSDQIMGHIKHLAGQSQKRMETGLALPASAPAARLAGTVSPETAGTLASG